MKTLFQKRIFTTNHIPFGLDLSDLSMKIVQLGSRGKYQYVRSFGGVTIPTGGIVDGEIKKPDVVREAIRYVLGNVSPHKMNTKQVFCSLPEGKAFLRIVDIPKMKPEEVGEALKWEIEENIPMGADQVYYDWEILERNFSKKSNKMSVLLIAVSKQTVDSFIETVESAGLEVVGMGIESLAQVQSLLAEDIESTQTTLVIDIGDRRTTLLFAIGGTICFTSSMAVSSQHFNEVMMKGLKLNARDAEQLKREQGVGSFVKKDALFQTVAPILEDLVLQVQTSVDFFLTGLGYTQRIDRVLLCGGGANMKGLSTYVSKRLNIPAQRGNPWTNLNLGENVPPITYEQSLQYSTAIGLAVLGLQYVYEGIS